MKHASKAQHRMSPIDVGALETLMRNRVAMMRFPGPNYYEVLEWLHRDLRPKHYLEIGVRRGHSLRLAMPPTIALGIDPFPEVDQCWSTQTYVLPVASTEFFAKHALREFFGADRFSLAFVDGLHRFEQVIDDIFNLERYARPESVIAVHDTLPLDKKTAAGECRTEFYTGDVWKIIPFLKHCRPDLELITIRTAPSGLTLIRRLNPSRAKSESEAQARLQFQELPWEYYQQHRNQFLETIPNDRGAIGSWLGVRVSEPQ